MSDAAPTRADRGDLKSTAYEFFMLAIAILSIANLPLLAIFPYQSQYWYLVGMIEVSLTLIFVGDFVYRLRTATSKWGYFYHQQGFLDLLSCVPALRIFRLFRILRAVRIVRRLGGPSVLRELREELAESALYLIVVVGITTLEVVGLLELYFEADAPGANITTAGDALWWGYVTATTVGYGDYFPVTTGGRISALIMLTVGVGLFATFSGFLASQFLGQHKREPEGGTRGFAEVRALLEQQEQTTAELRAKIDQLENASAAGSA